MPDSAPPSDRRQAQREVTCFPAYVKHDETEKEVALIADIAMNGALLLVRGKGFREGERVRLELLIDVEAASPRLAKGRVVRIEPLPIERVSVWTHQVAVEFDLPIVLDPHEQQRVREQCERLGIRR